MTRDIALYVQDILRNMADAETFVEGMDFSGFEHDRKTFNAVVRSLEIVGEATKHVPDAVRDRHPEIPWKEMAGMRDKIAHFYFGVDAKKVWLVVQEDIPRIKPLVQQVLQDLQG